MGFFDKIKGVFAKIKEENRNFGSTMARINNNDFCGNVNRGVKNGDFWEGSYISLENGKGVIYGSSQDDYVFGAEDIANFTCTGTGTDVPRNNIKLPTIRFIVEFKDGKKAQADILTDKVDAFKLSMKLM